ncbi:hypothetical protein H6F50_21245 [Coleofasciculus sp. FACHB-712]|uniref:hypothetical protein n=1 Tax=Coleofasciculus sp. FACHB-712 TaxID=2692789 RepID=UPI001687895D|nr:hypothetical protein [Coleofasciculus sp. FACHB-712]MBD1944852.1 hypothetical protein [Coleofasciculus sp. FACHB-712]
MTKDFRAKKYRLGFNLQLVESRSTTQTQNPVTSPCAVPLAEPREQGIQKRTQLRSLLWQYS